MLHKILVPKGDGKRKFCPTIHQVNASSNMIALVVMMIFMMLMVIMMMMVMMMMMMMMMMVMKMSMASRATNLHVVVSALPLAN